MTETGHFVKYVNKKFSADSLALLDHVLAVAEEYEGAGYVLSVRQAYYQLVARGLIPNTGKSYARVQSLISDGRLAGLVSWTAFEDRGRSLKGVQTYDSPGDIVRSAASSYRADLWAGQRFRPEVWIEKAALEGVIEGICMNERVDFYACRGYDSQSQSWRAGRRFRSYLSKGQTPIVLHFGDHDPSGLDMTRDNRERLEMFAGFKVTVIRMALNMNQIEEYQPPPNPAKLTDSRATAYVEEHGYESWELDALDPRVIQQLVADQVAKLRDEDLWSRALAAEVEERRTLDDFAKTFGG